MPLASQVLTMSPDDSSSAVDVPKDADSSTVSHKPPSDSPPLRDEEAPGGEYAEPSPVLTPEVRPLALRRLLISE
jgi:hypothetical protein